MPKSARPVGGVKKTAKVRRPHTAEGASRGDWGKSMFFSCRPFFNHVYSFYRIAASVDGDEADESSAKQDSTPTRIKHTPSRSVSSPMQSYSDAKSLADIRIVETSATPVESPQTPEAVTRPHHHHHHHLHHHHFASADSTKEHKRTMFPPRSRTPDPELHLPVDAYTTGVPLVRVATAPLHDSHSDAELGTGSGVASDKRTGSLVSRRMGGVGGAQKLARMGFSIDTHGHHNHYSPPGSHSSSRSPSKARFGGIKNLMQSLKGKS